MTDIDHAAVGREYADNLLGEPAVSSCLRAMAVEIERLRWKVKTTESAARYALDRQPALTDEEQKAVEWARCMAKMHHLDNAADTLRGLLARCAIGSE